MPIQRIPLAQPIESRDGTFGKDSYTTNYIFQIRNQKKEVVKRPGLALIQNVMSYTGTTGAATNGIRDFNGKLVAVINNTVVYFTPGASYTSLGSAGSSGGRAYMTKSSLDTYLFFHKDGAAYVIDSSWNMQALNTGGISSITVNNGGLGWSDGSYMVILPSPFGGTTATATINWNFTSSSGTWPAGTATIYSVTVNNRGTNYAGTVPNVTAKPPAFWTAACTGTAGINQISTVSALANTAYAGMTVTGGSGLGAGTRVQSTRTPAMGNPINLTVNNAGAVSGTLTFQNIPSNYGSFSAVLIDMPTGPYVAGSVFLDNYFFVGIAASNRIYNCNIGDPYTWNPLNYVTFEQTNDQLVAIGKHINYLVAFGQKSTQFFYDAANATGSPLALASSYTSEIGCASGDSIVSTSNTMLWISTSASYGRSVSMMEGVVAKRISTDYIDRHLLASNLTDVKAFAYTHSGHTLYILTLTDIGQTLVYDLTIGEWYSWTQFGTQTTPEASVGTTSEYYFRPGFGAVLNGVPYCLDSYNSKLYQLSTTTYQDDSQPMYCRTVTDLADNGTTKRKFYGRLEIVGDKIAGGTMFVSHTGNDYKDYSYSRAVNLNADRSQVYQCGADRRRAWQFLSTSNVPLRLQSVEIDFDIGEMDQTQNVGGGQ